MSTTSSVISGGNVKELSQSMDVTHSKAKAKTLARTSSIKNENTKSNQIYCLCCVEVITLLFTATASGQRRRSNSAFQVPNWLRKRRTGATSRVTEREREQHPPDSIEQLFEVFKKTAVIRVDPLSKYIVSSTLAGIVHIMFTYTA